MSTIYDMTTNIMITRTIYFTNITVLKAEAQ